MKEKQMCQNHRVDVQDVCAKLIVIAVADETLAIRSVLEALVESA